MIQDSEQLEKLIEIFEKLYECELEFEKWLIKSEDKKFNKRIKPLIINNS